MQSIASLLWPRAAKSRRRAHRSSFTLQARQAALSTAVARLLVQNNESEEQAAQRIAQIYDRVQRQVYLFLTAHADGHRAHELVFDSFQPALVCATGRAVRATQ